MLEKAEGEKCHATNFLKAFSSIPDGTSCNHNELVLLSVSGSQETADYGRDFAAKHTRSSYPVC